MTHRCGYVALVGCPNVGKSSLMNALVGESLAIVTSTAQTTRQRITGIYSADDVQLVLLDTPGFHNIQRPLNEAMVAWVRSAVRDADLSCWVVTPRGLADDDLLLWKAFRERPYLIVVNKADVAPPDAVQRCCERLAAKVPEVPIIMTSVKTGEGIEALRDAMIARVPEGPALFSKDDYTDRPIRFLVAEFIRQAAIDAMHAELPHSLAVEIESFEEGAQLHKIHAAIIVEKTSHKGIVIGQGGKMIKRIGTNARPNIEGLVGTKVYLELFVRVVPGWTKDPKQLRELGLISS